MVESVQVEGNVTGAEAPTEPTQTNRPEWLPEKFNSPEDLSKAYGELEKQFTQSRQEATQSEAEQPAPETTEDARETVENAGLDFDAMQQEFNENGNLSEDTYKNLQDKGIPKEMVDAYVKGQESIAANYETEMYSFAGGKDSYTEMAQWASDNLPESEIDAFNETIQSGNQAQARLAIDGLMSRYRDNGGAEPTLVGGKASASVDTYSSWAQVTKDMSTAEYKKDPAFRATVEKKLGRSSL
jgi:hypothetical protein